MKKSTRSSRKQPQLNKKTVLLCLALAAVIAGTYFTFIRKSENLHTVDGIYSALKKEIAYRYSNLDLFADTDTWVGYRKIGVPVSVDGYEYRLSSGAVPSIVFSLGEPEDKPDKTYHSFFSTHVPIRVNNIPDATSAFTEIMKRGGFHKIYDGEDKEFSTWSIIYEHSDGITCVRSDQGAASMTVSCYNHAILQSVAAAARPFVFAYHQSHPKVDFEEWYVGPFEVKRKGVVPEYAEWLEASKAKGYELAEFILLGGVDERDYAFYRNEIDEFGYPGNKYWKYAGERLESCDYYKKDPERRQVFYDQICMEGNKDSRRLDTNNPVER